MGPWTISLWKSLQKSPSLVTWQDDTLGQDHYVLQQLQTSWQTHSSSQAKARYEITFVQDILSRCQGTLVLTFTRDEQRAKCGGSCWWSLTTLFDRQLLHKIQPYCGINARIGLFINKFHRWCLRMRAGDFHLDLQQKRCGMIQDATSWQIRARYVSKHGL